MRIAAHPQEVETRPLSRASPESRKWRRQGPGQWPRVTWQAPFQNRTIFQRPGAFLEALFFFCRPGCPDSGRIKLVLSRFGARPSRSFSFHRRCPRVGARASWPKEDAMRPGALRTGVYGCCPRCERPNPSTNSEREPHGRGRGGVKLIPTPTPRRNGLGSSLIFAPSGEIGARQNKLIFVLQFKLMEPILQTPVHNQLQRYTAS